MAQQHCEEIFGRTAKLYSEGRQAGWAVVYNLPDVDGWDAIAISKWTRFARRLRAEVDWLCSAESVFDLIDANGWAEPDAREGGAQ